MLYEWTSTALKCALTATNIQVGFRKAGIWPLDREAAKSSMAPSTGFEEGVACPDRCGATGRTNHRADGVTCLTGHLHLPNRVVIGRAGHAGLGDVGAACMHVVQTEEDAGECSSEGFDVDPVEPSAAWEDEVVPNAPSAPSPSIKWCTLVCTTTSTSPTAKKAPTRHATKIYR